MTIAHAENAVAPLDMKSIAVDALTCSITGVQDILIRILEHISNSLQQIGTATFSIWWNNWAYDCYLTIYFSIMQRALSTISLVFILVFLKVTSDWSRSSEKDTTRTLLKLDRVFPAKFCSGQTCLRKQWSLSANYCIFVILYLSCLFRVSAQTVNSDHDLHRRRLFNNTEQFSSASSRSFTVPVGVTMLAAVLSGGCGGTVTTSDGMKTGIGGTGDTIMVNIPVTPGEVLQVNIGGNGGISGPGFNGGGAGCTENPNQPSAGGGGATDIRRTPYGMNDRLAVAGGGGGGSSNFSANGGNAGYPVADGGYAGFGPASIPSGGTDTAGGTVLTPNGCMAAGAAGFGGSCCNGHGGGGGAGYYGGASSYLAGGGGGSSYVDVTRGVELLGHGPLVLFGSATLEYTNFDPTAAPTVNPTVTQTGLPTSQPTSQPSDQPSVQPSSQPSTQPATIPSSQPSAQPSNQPSVQPTSQPSGVPSIQPSEQPSSQPTEQPNTKPTTQPTIQPSGQPSRQPSSRPTIQPSQQPSTQPSSQPSLQPSARPSQQPSFQPSIQPTIQPTSRPSVQPSGQPTTQPSTQPTARPLHVPTSCPSSKPSTQPSSQPSSLPSAQPTVQPTQQPSSQPLTAPTSSPTALPTQLLSAREYAHLFSVNHSMAWSQLAHIQDNDWGCGDNGGGSSCVTLFPSGIFQTQYNFIWSMITSALQTDEQTKIILSGITTTTNSVSTDIAICEIHTMHLQCTVKSFPHSRFVAGTFAPSVNKLVYIGTSSGLASVTVSNRDHSNLMNFRYTNNLGLAISMTHMQSHPYFIGSFVAGTCTTTTGSITNIFAAVVRTDSGAMTAMYVTPASGAIVNSAELVNTMALEFTQPDTFIGGGIQTLGEPTISAYFVCVNALYQSVNYGRRLRFKPSVVNGVRRKLTQNSISSSVINSLVRVDTILYLLVSWNTSKDENALNRMSLLKTDMTTGTIVQQVHIVSNTSSIHCSHMYSAGLFFGIACTVQYSINDTRSLLLSVDRQLTFSQLPQGYMRYNHEVFLSESMVFHRTKVPVTVDSTAVSTSEYTFSTMDGSPTVQPTIIATSKPSIQPSEVPSSQPSSSPTATPSVSPQPTSQPSTSGPTNTYKPTVKPTLSPSRTPTATPTVSPTKQPTNKPTARPTAQPSMHPTTMPSVAPTFGPSRAPQCKPTLKPSPAPSVTQTQTPSFNTAILAASVHTSNGYSQTVFIILYVLGSIIGIYGLYRLFHCYIQTLDDFAWQRKMRAHLKEVQQSLAGQPTHIPSLARRLASYKKATRKAPVTNVAATTATLDGELLTTEPNPHNGGIEGEPMMGAYINHTPMRGAYINNPATTQHNSQSMETMATPVVTAISRLPTVHSIGSSSLELSSLHSSERSDFDARKYNTGLHHAKSKESVMEEGSAHTNNF